MEIVIKKHQQMQKTTLQEFADEHHLVMEVHERADFGLESAVRYYAMFRDCEVLSGRTCYGVFGNGATPNAAIKRYAEEISGKLLVKDAFKETRKEMSVPILLPYKPEKEK